MCHIVKIGAGLCFDLWFNWCMMTCCIVDSLSEGSRVILLIGWLMGGKALSSAYPCHVIPFWHDFTGTSHKNMKLFRNGGVLNRISQGI